MTEESLKSGSEIVDTFFENLSPSDKLNKEVVDALKKLQKAGKLTPTNISNALDTIRNEAPHDVNK
jgi:hypothetical protein